MSVAAKCLGRGARVMLLTVLGACATNTSAHETKSNARLPVVGPAPEFVLSTQSGERLSFTDLRGQANRTDDDQQSRDGQKRDQQLGVYRERRARDGVR